MEHTYDPDKVLGAAAGLQGPGDYLIVAVPNQKTEQPMSVFFFLPHLHSFTRASLERAAARHGYAVVDDRHTGSKQLVYVFRKQRNPAAEADNPAPEDGIFERTVEHYVRAFSLDRWRVGLRRLWWFRRGGPTGQRWMLGTGSVGRASLGPDLSRGITTTILVRSRSGRSGDAHTSAEESPFEIQFSGPVRLFVK